MDILLVILLTAVPAAGLATLALLMNRWGKKHDPMGGDPGDMLPIGRARRPDVYYD